jgi:hypothetical protein
LWSDFKAEPKKSEEDDLLDQAVQIAQESDRASISLLQRKLRIGYSRAARLMDLMEQKGYVGPDEGPTKGREVFKGKLPPPTVRPPRAASPPPAVRATTKSAPPPRTNGTSTPSSEPTASRQDRKFEGEDLGDFDDWSDEDWADLDKS